MIYLSPNGNVPKDPNIWFSIDGKGEVTYLDWDKAEYFAQCFIRGIHTQENLSAYIIVAVRDHMLKLNVDKLWAEKENKNGG